MYFSVYLLTPTRTYCEKPLCVFSEHFTLLHATSFIFRPGAQAGGKARGVQSCLRSRSVCSRLLRMLPEHRQTWAEKRALQGAGNGLCQAATESRARCVAVCTCVCPSIPTWLLQNENSACLQPQGWSQVCRRRGWSVGLGRAVVPEGDFQVVLITILCNIGFS